MTKTFKQAIDGIRTAVVGKEVREDIAQMGEYVEQFASTATTKASEAAKSATAAASSASASKSSQTAAENAKTDAVFAINRNLDSAISSIDAKKKSSVQEVNATQTTAVNAVKSAQSSAVAAVEKAGKDTLATIPSDYANMPWTMCDLVCPPIEETGNPVECYPVPGYPLGVVAEWKPTQTGSGDPSPENIRAISGRNNLFVTRCGENLAFNVPESPLTNDVIIFKQKLAQTTVTVSGHIKGNYSSGAAALFNFVNSETKTNSYYTVKQVLNSTKDTDTIDTNFKITVTRNFDTIYIYFKKSGFASFSEDSRLTSFSIVYGTSAPTTYTPYTGQTNALTLPSTIYGGTVDAVTGEGEETWAIMSWPGDTAVWHEGSTKTGWSQSENAVAYFTFCPIEGSSYDVMSNIFRYNPSIVGDSSAPYTIGARANYIAIRIPRSECASLSYVNTWLANHNAVIAYTTSQSAYKAFTATGAQPIPALSGINTVITGADKLTVTGAADPIKRITDLEDAVASMTTNE